VNVGPVTSMSPVELVQRKVGGGFPAAEQRSTVPPATVDPSVTVGSSATFRGQSADKIVTH